MLDNRILNNISPYVKSLSMVAASKLIKLFELFSSPKFLFRSTNNHQFAHQLLAIFENIIQYQYEGESERGKGGVR